MSGIVRAAVIVCLSFALGSYKVTAQSQLNFFHEDSLKSTVSFLASDELQGRGNFTYSLENAALFISAEFKIWGLQPLHNNTQSYLLPFVVGLNKETFESVTINGESLKSKSFYFSSSYQYPPEIHTEDFTIVALNSFSTKDVISNLNQYIDSISGPILFTVPASQKAMLPFIRKKSSALHKPFHTVLIIVSDDEHPDVSITLSKEARRNMLFNVAAVLPGKRLADEVVLITAHYDHIGVNMTVGDGISNGANDNASGTAAMLAMAKYFATTASNERTIVFVAFAGEELGLKGSFYMANNFNCSNVKSMFNLEMLGKPGKEGKKALIITEENNSDLKKIMRKYSKAIKIIDDRNTTEKLFSRSDNYPFALNKVAAHTFMCFSDTDNTYHKTTDEVKTLDFENMSLLVSGLLPGIEAVVSGAESPKD